MFRVGDIVWLLFYCFLEGLPANHMRPYESCYIALLPGRQLKRLGGQPTNNSFHTCFSVVLGNQGR